jgi:GNAT superfamily N-acetyltransferase
MSGHHPTTTAADFVVVEDTRTKRIVSSACLISQVWRYEDIRFPVGRPELIATDPAYRRQGLVRAIFETIHALSASYGHMVQGITGIPWFYRQFGYEYALSLGAGRVLNIQDVPTLEADKAESYLVRLATEADIPTLMSIYNHHCAHKLVTSLIDEARWRYELSGRSSGTDQVIMAYLIEDNESRVVGYYLTPARLWGSNLVLHTIFVNEGISLWSVLPSVLRALKAQGEAYAAEAKRPLMGIYLALGLEHPTYELLDAKLKPLQRLGAWYIRVADLPGFIRHIAPVLEQRLSRSAMSGFSGKLNITFYRGGLRLVFERGKISHTTRWQAPDTNEEWQGAGFPPLVFLQLLFGFRSLQELRYSFPDCWADEEAAFLLNALFPKKASWVVVLS